MAVLLRRVYMTNNSQFNEGCFLSFLNLKCEEKLYTHLERKVVSRKHI